MQINLHFKMSILEVENKYYALQYSYVNVYGKSTSYFWLGARALTAANTFRQVGD